MAVHVVRLLAREEIARKTIALHFERPESFEFKPGQYVSLRLIDPPETDDEGISRSFSITAAPHEPNLTFATRIRDTAMKRVLNSMPIGTEVKMTGPFGTFTLDADAIRPAVLITGGIGITPFRSIVVHAAHERLPQTILLFYSNRTPEDAAFLQELQSLEALNPNYKLVAVMTEIGLSQQSWKGERGRVNGEMIERYLDDVAAPTYYVVGPPAMVSGVREMLLGWGLDSAAIRVEAFKGY